MLEIRRYVTESGSDVFGAWLASVRDARARARIATRIGRLESENLGDCKPVGGGVWEMRIDYGPGYRIYYAMVGKTVVLLLCGGDKRKQTSDIQRAINFLKDYSRRTDAP